MRRTLIFLTWVFVGIQFIRTDYDNPEVLAGNDFIEVENPPENINNLLKNSCYPCHSNETVYPWYAQVAPASFLITHHVHEGREHLNFSEWKEMDNDKRSHLLDEMIYELNEHNMPQFPYALAHSEAKLTDEERDELTYYFTDLMYE